MRSISLRMRGSKTELEEAGESIEGMAESTSKLRAEVKALSGVDIMMNDTTFKVPFQMMDELAAKWADFDDITRANLTQLLSGTHHSNTFAAIMENFDIARDALDTSHNSEGSAMAEQREYMMSIQYSLDVLKSSWQEFSNVFLSTDLFKGVIDGLSTMLNILTKITSLGGGLGGVGIVGLLFGTAGTIKKNGFSGLLKDLD